jgi:hypothetical protein
VMENDGHRKVRLSPLELEFARQNAHVFVAASREIDY